MEHATTIDNTIQRATDLEAHGDHRVGHGTATRKEAHFPSTDTVGLRPGSEHGASHGWDTAPALTQADVDAVNTQMERILTNKVEERTRVDTPDTHIAVASDASDTGAATIILDLSGKGHHEVTMVASIDEVRGAPRELRMQTWQRTPIHIRELRTGLFSIKQACELNSWRPCNIWLSIDNTVAQAGIDAEQLADQATDEELASLEDFRHREIIVRTVRTKSEEMPADAASRGQVHISDDVRRRCDAMCGRIKNLRLLGALSEDQGHLVKRNREDCSPAPVRGPPPRITSGR